MATAVTLSVAVAGFASPAAAAAPLASVEANQEGVTCEVWAVERKGSVLTLEWAARNASTAEARVRFQLVNVTI